MQALAIIPNFDVLEDNPPGLGTGGELSNYTFCFQGANKTLHGGIVVAIPHPAHANLAVVVAQVFLIGMAGLLASLVRVMHPARSW